MKKLDERSHWDNEWADAFKDEKQAPSERVWQNIDGILANKEVNKYKKRAVFYKWLAAASVFISACGAVLFMLSNPQNTTQQGQADAFNQEQTAEQAGQSGTAGSLENDFPDQDGPNKNDLALEENERIKPNSSAPNEPGSSSYANENLAKENNTGSAIEKSETGSSYAATEQRRRKPAAQHNNEHEGSAKAFASRYDNGRDGEGTNSSEAGTNLARIEESGNVVGKQGQQPQSDLMDPSTGLAFLDMKGRGFVMEEAAIPLVEVDIRKVWMPSDLLQNKSKVAKERFWLGASVASNSFNPNFVDNAPSPLLMAENSFKPDIRSRSLTVAKENWDQSQESIISFAGGIQGAAKLSEKWVLQGGVQYGTYKSSGNAGAFTDASGTNTYPLHYANLSMESMNGLSDASGSNVIDLKNMYSANIPIQAINTFEFVSVPLTIGYIVFDKKVGLLINPGVSSEFFLSNQLTDQNEQLGDYTVKGSDSPYNVVHFRGLVGAQLFYKLGDNYVVSIEPSYQHAITNFNKSASYFDSRPSNISLGAGFKYIFR